MIEYIKPIEELTERRSKLFVEAKKPDIKKFIALKDDVKARVLLNLLIEGERENIDKFNAYKAAIKAKAEKVAKAEEKAAKKANPKIEKKVEAEYPHFDFSSISIEYQKVYNAALSGDNISGHEEDGGIILYSRFRIVMPFRYDKSNTEKVPQSERLKLKGIQAKNVDVANAEFVGAEMENGNWRGSKFMRAVVGDANMEGCDLRSNENGIPTDLTSIVVNEKTNLKFAKIDKKSFATASPDFSKYYGIQNNKATYDLIVKGDVERFNKFRV